ncbi:MAG: hypothetical protein JNL83_28970 [Myxococcales bacterium]|nr:hypothetical protein [Myxococcales bacterium]
MRFSPLVALALAACSSSSPKTTKPAPPPSSEPVAPPPAPVELSLATLEVGRSALGFTPAAIYTDGNDQPIGARLVHDKTKFLFDYLRIESAPQAFIWVNSFPTSDKGEPHTQEHLLLGKGNRGRRMGSFQAMALAESSAFTDQWRTAYHVHTVAGRDVFWNVLQDQLGAMLDADYTDEEIRREVRNFGVDKATDGVLRLEEKGTVYNEMVRAYETPDATAWREALRIVYGAQHPLAYESGGYPDAIRTMTPEDIRTFHIDNYHLANMGMIATFPSAMTLTEVLAGADRVLLASNARTGKVTTEADVPSPVPSASQTPVFAEYPFDNDKQPSPVMLVWPATRGKLDLTERTLMGLFLDALAGDESTPLYKQLIDSKTRTLDIGARSIGFYTSNNLGYPVFLFVNGVRADALDATPLQKVRTMVAAELARIAKLPDGDPELAAIKRRIETRVVNSRRGYAKFLDSPPGFGFRGTSSAWMDHMNTLAKLPGDKKSLTLKPQFAAIDQILAGGGNPWRARIAAWGLDVPPAIVAAKPSTKLRKELDAARDARIAAELARLRTVYGTKDDATTLAKYAVDYDAQTKILEEAAASTPLPDLVPTPPMTYDDDLKYTMSKVGGVDAFTATFDSMQSSRVSIAFDLHGIPAADQMYLALLPSLMSEVGIKDGTTIITSEEMVEQLRTEILSLSVSYSEDLRTNRAELVVAGAGNNVAETKLALGWMRRVLLAPDWNLGNLARLRDVVDQALTATRAAMQTSEEDWVEDTHDAWWRQDSLLHLHIGSFLTQAHDLHRLRWQLMDPIDEPTRTAALAFLGKLAGAAKLPRAQLVQLAASLAGDAKAKPPAGYATTALSERARAIATAAGKDLGLLLADLPDASLAADWTYLCRQMKADLELGAPKALDKLKAVRAMIVGQARARLTAVGSSASHAALAPEVASFVAALPVGAARQAPDVGKARPIADRLKDHDKATPVTYVGLYAPSTSSGVFVNTAPSTDLTKSSDDALLDYLASRAYSGHGAHSLFMKTWAAGLAYSNGMRVFLRTGRIQYYAERTPLLPQTMRFVVGQLKAAKPDANIARYAIAKAFDSRIAAGYEARAQAMANDLADGITPDLVRAFRTALLKQSAREDLAKELAARYPKVYGKVLPGYGTPSPETVHYVIGPAKQLDAYQEYLRASVDKKAVLHRLYPRDFWIPAKL